MFYKLAYFRGLVRLHFPDHRIGNAVLLFDESPMQSHQILQKNKKMDIGC